jgi:hypothetical protein
MFERMYVNVTRDSNNQEEKIMTAQISRRISEIAEDKARSVAAEWSEMGIGDARAMLGFTQEAMESGDDLPEPAEFAKDELHECMPPEEVEIAWPEMVTKIGRHLALM